MDSLSCFSTSIFHANIIFFLASNQIQSWDNLQLLGFFGGIHLAVLSAFICQRHPSASLSALILLLFKTFALWPWPTPVILQDQIARPFIPTHDKVLWMPIQLPCSPYEFCHSNIIRSTFYKIRTEFLRGHMLTKVYDNFDYILSSWSFL